MNDEPFVLLRKEMSKVPKRHHDARFLFCLQNVIRDPEHKLLFFVESDLLCQVDKISLLNGIVLYPWPQRPELEDLKIDSKEFHEVDEQLTRGRYLFIGEYLPEQDAAGMGFAVLQAISLIDRSISLVGFATGAKMYWYPKAFAWNANLKNLKPILPVSFFKTLNESNIREVQFILNKLTLMDPEDKADIESAIDWHWQGHNSPSIFNSFESYWKAIESLSNTWKRKLGMQSCDDEMTNKLVSEAKKTNYKKYIDENSGKLILPFDHTLKFVRWARDNMDPPIKSIIDAAFIRIFGLEKAQSMVNRLFKGEPSIKELRDKIAHGLISESNPDCKALIEKKRYELEPLSREFIMASTRLLSNE